ncbi:HD domain-containing protein [Candidatus Woesearchaeota archaeon]|nr:HD domain-containing protein [Candidatus Woesearchaeota archaeon]
MSKSAAEIRDPIHGYIYASELERRVIDTPVFQRLRRIRQLASAHLTYPGAQHSRFEHSVGAMFLAGRAASVLSDKYGLKAGFPRELRLAALLHDVGHGPFSHLFEEVLSVKTDVTHEDITRRIIRETEIGEILSKHGINIKEFSSLPLGIPSDYPRYMNDVISGVLSVDTMDYLLRDSYFTGVEYGKVDVHRVINSYEVIDDKIGIDRAGLYALEALLIARYEMFRAVYFHRTVRAAEIMIIKALTLADDEFGFSDVKDLNNYLSLTDEPVLASLLSMKPSNPKLRQAKQLAADYASRNLLKCVFERMLQRRDTLIERIFSQRRIRDELAREIADKAHVNENTVFIDVPTTPSVPMTSLHESLSEILVVSKGADGKSHEKVKAGDLPLLGSILGYMDMLRVYTIQQNRKKVEKAVNAIFKKEGLMSRISV